MANVDSKSTSVFLGNKNSTMKPFTRSEIIGVFIIFLVLVGVSIPNFITSLTRSRDQARKDDLGSIVNTLDNYYLDFGEFPKSSEDGKIIACKKPGDVVRVDSKKRLIVNLIPCEWGKDPISDLTPGSTKVYVASIPRDPDYLTRGSSYLYFSNGLRYQIYASLERSDWDEYDPKIVARNLMCGTKVCNIGRSFSETPTDISIEEYEIQLK